MMLSMAPANRLTGKGESGSTILAKGMVMSPNRGPFTPSSTVFWDKSAHSGTTDRGISSPSTSPRSRNARFVMVSTPFR